jgi:hemerythrin
MPLMTWTEEMSVGVKVLDNDHKTLIRLLNDLHDGIEAGRTRATLESVLEGLSRYTKIHFAREERLFAETGFAGAAAHKAEHDLMARRVMNMQSRFENGQSLELSLEAMNFIKSWLTHHIQGSDREYGPCLNAKGIK